MPKLMQRKPDWFKIKLPTGEKYSEVKGLVKTNRLNTICEEAKCPNISECWSHGTATFLILGHVCTRYCSYCNVKTGKPLDVDADEGKKVADSVKKLGLRYVVVTSVTRDDLEDGGASLYVDVIKEIKKVSSCKVELLIPDLKTKDGIDVDALKKIIDAKPDVLGHNIEAVRSVFSEVRKGGNYDVSLELLKKIKEIDADMRTKSGIMVGFGESFDEIKETMQDLRDVGVDFLTIGQYLQPSEKHAKISKFYKPKEFEELKKIGLEMGFKHVESGPLVRSSYRADKLNAMIK
jgi:lipoic acid synthetase|tara:strand:+ start:54137 stop:55012 length:876 start_codon:yes stop_codon:yes gene_type:complete